MTTPIIVAFGDGHNPRLMDATLLAIKESGADVSIESIEIGQRIYNMGGVDGVLPSAWDVLSRTKLLLKAPNAKPENAAFKDVGAAIRDHFGLDGSHRIVETDEDGEALAAAYINESFALFEPLGEPPALKNMLKAAQMLLTYIGFTHITLKPASQPEDIAL
jgi:hypothetical protein